VIWLHLIELIHLLGQLYYQHKQIVEGKDDLEINNKTLIDSFKLTLLKFKYANRKTDFFVYSFLKNIPPLPIGCSKNSSSGLPRPL
jgi:hypothetical protein